MESSSSNHKNNKKIIINNNLYSKSNQIKNSLIISFRGDSFIKSYLSKCITKSEFIRKAINWFIVYLNEPEKVMKELKLKYPEKYKAIGRRRF